jgi:hypothetical protein
MAKTKPYKLPKGKGLILRTCAADMTGYGGFKWPKRGLVKCPDWDPAPRCGGGLHGLWQGEGSGTLLKIDDSSRVWIVAEVDEAKVVHINDGDSIKCKVPSAKVVFCGDSKGATDFIAIHCKDAKAIVGGTSTSGDGGTSTSGDGGTSTSGVGGTSTSGDRGTSTSGVGGTSTSGDRGTSTSGVGGTSQTGDVGIIVCRWHDSAAGRFRLAVGYVGEDGIKSNTFYRANERGKLVEVTK